MGQLQDISEIVKVYLEKSIEPNGFWDNVVIYVLPILSMLVVIIGGIWTIYTYIKGKNREINEKILSEVYAPMYQFFVKNDALTDFAEGNVDYKEYPLLEWMREKTVENFTDGEYNIKKEVFGILGLTRKDFIETLDSVNMGLAPQELITLYNIYKTVNYLVDHTGNGPKKDRVNDYQVSLEYTIRCHAYSGYQKYCKKIGINVSSETDLFVVKEDCIKLKLPNLENYTKED